MPGSFHVTRKQNRARELNEIESETTLPRPAVSFPRDLVKARVTSLQKSRVFGDNWACWGGCDCARQEEEPPGGGDLPRHFEHRDAVARLCLRCPRKPRRTRLRSPTLNSAP